MSGPFFGKYRGLVVDNDDPERILRLRATVPDVFGESPSGWALPCMPFGGPGSGLFALPPVGATVWVEFEHGDAQYPVWVGSFWGSTADMPADLLTSPPDIVMLVTPGGHTVTVSDLPDAGIVLTTASGARLAMTPSGIEVDNGKGATVSLQGPSVSVNSGALEVT